MWPFFNSPSTALNFSSARSRSAMPTVALPAWLLTRVDLKYDAFGNRIERDLWTSGTGVTGASRCGFDGWKTHLDVSGAAPSFVGMENFDTWIDMDGNNSATVHRFYGDQV